MSEKPTPKAPEPLSLTPEVLQQLIATAVSSAVEAANKPKPPSEAEVRKLREEQDSRSEMSKLVLSELENKRLNQQLCSHTHFDGASHGVFIEDGNYILCQRCQAKIRPESSVRTDKHSIYDTAIFNRLLQSTLKTDL